MQSNFKIPIPPRANFPSRSYIPVIEQASQQIDSFLSSLFERVEQEETPEFGANASLEQVRGYFESVDKQLRASYLRVEILQKCLGRAKDAYRKLIDFRQDKWRDFEENEIETPNGAKLPLEVVSSICSFRKGDFTNDLACWGDVLFEQQLRVRASSEFLDENFIAKSRRIFLIADNMKSFAACLKTTHKWVGLRADEAPGSDQHSTAPEKLFEFLQEAKPILSQLESLEISFGKEFKGYQIACPKVAHTCTACQVSDAQSSPSVTLPSCKTAKVPLVYLPFVGPALSSNLVHLTVYLPDNINLNLNFGSHFHHITLHRLQSLYINGQGNNVDARYVSRGPRLETPELICLEIAFPRLEGAVVVAFLNRLNCTKLKCAILSDIFVVPPTQGSHSIQPFLIELEKVVKALDDLCKHLKRLSFYVHHESLAHASVPCSTWAGRSPTNPVHQYLDTLYSALSEVGNHSVKLPQLEHLSLPFDGHIFGYESLVKFLGARATTRFPIRTLELSPRPTYRHTELKMLHLELYVDNVIIHNTDFVRESHFEYYVDYSIG